MTEHYSLMVPGTSEHGTPLEVHAPFDRSVIATVDTATEAVIETALATAYALFRDRDRWLPAAKRIDILLRAAALVEQRAEHLAVEAAREGGKPLIDSRVEIARAVDGLRSCVECVRTQHGYEVPMGLNAASSQRWAFTTHEPIGVVLAYSAFNHPFNLIVHQAGPAIAAGCPVIVKPAQATPLSCYRLVSILREAGLPPEWCQALVIDRREWNVAMAADRRVGFLSFIGSGPVGWMLRGKLAPGARCSLEHGGVAPVVVAADADLDLAVPLLTKGGFYHAGQVCVSVQRIFAEKAVARPLAQRIAAAAEKLRVGDPTLPDTEVGPMIRPSEVERVDQWVREAIAGGAEALCGARPLSSTCYAPTVLFSPPDDSRVMTHEVFGPVVCVAEVDSVEAAIAAANRLNCPFQAAVFSRNIDTALRVARRIDAATVMINDHTAFRVDWMPFAGLREAGLGVGGIPYTFEEMQVKKQVVFRSPALG